MTETYLSWAILIAFAILSMIPLAFDSQKIKSPLLGFAVVLVQLAWVIVAMLVIAMLILRSLSVVMA